MSSKKAVWYTLLTLTGLLFVSSATAAETIKIGLNLALNGDRGMSGRAISTGAEMAKDEINGAGGIKIGSEKYLIEFVYADNVSNVQRGISNVLDLITKQEVLAIIGPNDSSRAIPAGGISNSFKTPLISPMSTNPKTTLDRPFVFRTCFLDPFQGQAMAIFASRELKATRAAVLFNVADAYPRGLAKFFKAAFEEINGEGSVVAFEEFRSHETDLSSYLKKITASEADVLFVPQYEDEIPRIVKQAQAAGWDKPMLGGDAWELSTCGTDCSGYYFTSHFAAMGTHGKAKSFVTRYQELTGDLPSGEGALGYDAVNLLAAALSSIDSLGNDIVAARNQIKDKLTTIRGFNGVSGVLDMTEGGDPHKSAVVIRINDKGEFESHKTIIPQ